MEAELRKSAEWRSQQDAPCGVGSRGRAEGGGLERLPAAARGCRHVTRPLSALGAAGGEQKERDPRVRSTDPAPASGVLALPQGRAVSDEGRRSNPKPPCTPEKRSPPSRMSYAEGGVGKLFRLLLRGGVLERKEEKRLEGFRTLVVASPLETRVMTALFLSARTFAALHKKATPFFGFPQAWLFQPIKKKKKKKKGDLEIHPRL